MLTRLIRSLAIAEADTPPWSLTWALWVVLIAIVAAFAGTLVAYGLTNGSLAAPLLGWTLGGLVTIAFIWRSRRADRESLRLSFKNVRLYIVLLLGVGMAVLVDVIGLGVTQAYLPAPELAGLFGIHVDLIAWLLAALFMLAVQPVAEELVFRAVLFVSLRQNSRRMARLGPERRDLRAVSPDRLHLDRRRPVDDAHSAAAGRAVHRGRARQYPQQLGGHRGPYRVRTLRPAQSARGAPAMKSVVVASTNPVKIDSARLGLLRMFPDEEFAVSGLSVPSGVSDQPMSDAETYQGALNRVNNVAQQRPDADYWVGMEGGIEAVDGRLRGFAWIVVRGRERLGQSRTATFTLPDEVAELVRQGTELGHADDIVFARRNSKQDTGSVGILTGDVITRTSYYEQAMILALIPFKNPDLGYDYYR